MFQPYTKYIILSCSYNCNQFITFLLTQVHEINSMGQYCALSSYEVTALDTTKDTIMLLMSGLRNKSLGPRNLRPHTSLALRARPLSTINNISGWQKKDPSIFVNSSGGEARIIPLARLKLVSGNVQLYAYHFGLEISNEGSTSDRYFSISIFIIKRICSHLHIFQLFQYVLELLSSSACIVNKVSYASVRKRLTQPIL